MKKLSQTLKKKLICFTLLCLGLLPGLSAQNMTLSLEEGMASPAAQLSDVAWISGYWTGQALGGTVEEFWAPPVGSSMMGCFKLSTDKSVKFYEMMTIFEHEGSLILRLKHFNEDLSGWEEKDESVDFKLVKIEKDRVYFDGLTMMKEGPNDMNVYVLFSDEAEREEGEFKYKRTATHQP